MIQTIQDCNCSYLSLFTPLYYSMNINKYCQLTLASRSRLAVLDNMTHPACKIFRVCLLKTDMSDRKTELFNSGKQTREDRQVSVNFSFTSLHELHNHQWV